MIFLEDFLWYFYYIKVRTPLDQVNTFLFEELKDEVLQKWVVEEKRLGSSFPYNKTFLAYSFNAPFTFEAAPKEAPPRRGYCKGQW